MPCENISLGRLKPCKDSVGGIKAVYFINYEDITDLSFSSTDTDVIETLGATGSEVSAYKYDVHFASSLTQNIQASMENGTVAYEQVLELSMPRLSKEDNKEIKILAYGSPHVIVEDQNNNLFVAGLVNGMEVTAGTIVTGTAMSDMSGYTLTLTGMERQPANFCEGDFATLFVTEVVGV